MDEHFASHQDIRSQLNKIMKVGILSHSDDIQHEEDNGLAIIGGQQPILIGEVPEGPQENDYQEETTG